MVISNLAQLCNWVQEQAAGLLTEHDPRLAMHAVEDIASVIARNANGQQLSWGDDWGWVLEMYGPEEMREIVVESAKIHGKSSRRR